MNTPRVSAIPMTFWCEPEVGEPAHGWFVRLADQNAQFSVRSMANGIGEVNGRNVVPEEMLDYARRFPIEHFDRLEWATPIFKGRDVRLMGVAVRKTQWSRNPRRFCPACLGEKPYHRAWWDLVHFKHCPWHDMDIVSSDVAGNQVKWHVPSFTCSDAHADMFVSNVERRDPPPPSLETYILGELGLIPRCEAFGEPLLQEMGDVLSFVDKFADILGRLDGNPRSLDSIIALFLRGPGALVEELRMTSVSAGNQAPERGGIRNVLGPSIASKIEKDKSLSGNLIHSIAVAVCEYHGFRTRQSKRRSENKFDTAHLRRMTSKSGRINALKKMIASLASEIHGVQITAEAVDEQMGRTILPACGDILSLDKLSKYLGVPDSLVHAIERTNRLKPLFKWYGENYYDKCEVEEMIESVSTTMVNTREADGMIKLKDVDMRCIRISDEEISKIFEKEDVLRCGDDFGDILVPGNAACLRKKNKKTKSVQSDCSVEMTMVEAMTRLQMHMHVVRALVAEGMLPVNSKKASMVKVNAHAVEDLRAKWASAIIYRSVIGKSYKNDEWKETGIEYMEIDFPKYTTLLVDRCGARKKFGLLRDPDDFAIGSAEYCLSDLVMAMTNVGFYTDGCQVHKRPVAGWSFRTANRIIAMTVCFDIHSGYVKTTWRIQGGKIEATKLVQSAGRNAKNMEAHLMGEVSNSHDEKCFQLTCRVDITRRDSTSEWFEIKSILIENAKKFKEIVFSEI